MKHCSMIVGFDITNYVTEDFKEWESSEKASELCNRAQEGCVQLLHLQDKIYLGCIIRMSNVKGSCFCKTNVAEVERFIPYIQKQFYNLLRVHRVLKMEATKLYQPDIITYVI